MILIAAAIALVGAAAQEGGAVPNEALKAELETFWAGFRSALAEYRLDDVKKPMVAVVSSSTSGNTVMRRAKGFTHAFSLRL